MTRFEAFLSALRQTRNYAGLVFATLLGIAFLAVLASFFVYIMKGLFS